MSRALGVSKKSWSTYTNEMLAIVEAVQMWRPYLLGQKFIIQTNQYSLKYFLAQKIAIPEQQKWMTKLIGHNYEIIYLLGRENVTDDALSLRPDNTTLNHFFVPQAVIWEEIKRAAREDDYTKKIAQTAQTGGPHKMDYYFLKAK